MTIALSRSPRSGLRLAGVSSLKVQRVAPGGRKFACVTKPRRLCASPRRGTAANEPMVGGDYGDDRERAAIVLAGSRPSNSRVRHISSPPSPTRDRASALPSPSARVRGCRPGAQFAHVSRDPRRRPRQEMRQTAQVRLAPVVGSALAGLDLLGRGRPAFDDDRIGPAVFRRPQGERRHEIRRRRDARRQRRPEIEQRVQGRLDGAVIERDPRVSESWPLTKCIVTREDTCSASRSPASTLPSPPPRRNGAWCRCESRGWRPCRYGPRAERRPRSARRRTPASRT